MNSKYYDFFKYYEDITRNTTYGSLSNKNSHKLALDKYYTPSDVAEKCFNKFMSMYGNNVTELIEPSAGSGVFLPLFEKSGKPWKAYDLFPEGNNIEKADFTKVNLGYKKGRAFVGNPPFGSRGTLMVQFYNQCCKFGDYMAFILPITMYKNTNSMYKFDLVYSEDIGTDMYSGRPVHCCFNIYARPEDGNLKSKEKADKLSDVSIYRSGTNGFEKADFDLEMIRFGTRAGKVLSPDEIGKINTVYKIKINNKNLFNEIKNSLENFNIDDYSKTASIPNVRVVDIINHLKKTVKGLNKGDSFK